MTTTDVRLGWLREVWRWMESGQAAIDCPTKEELEEIVERCDAIDAQATALLDLLEASEPEPDNEG